MAEISIAERLQRVRERIHQAEATCGRHQGAVRLLAVSKGQPASAVEEAFNAGQHNFGENYLQEAQDKIRALSALPLCWHFIGQIQSNKTKTIASEFSWVHSVYRQKIAQQLNDARPQSLPRLNICLQINFDDEANKAGIGPDLVTDLAASILQLPRLHLRGLMVIPKPLADEHDQYQSFLRVTHLLDSINQQLNLQLDTLSMGMSDDIQAAISAGSTIVRVGRAIFGARQ